jgi:hypothetical protein
MQRSSPNTAICTSTFLMCGRATHGTVLQYTLGCGTSSHTPVELSFLFCLGTVHLCRRPLPGDQTFHFDRGPGRRGNRAFNLAISWVQCLLGPLISSKRRGGWDPLERPCWSALNPPIILDCGVSSAKVVNSLQCKSCHMCCVYEDTASM